MVAIPHPLRAGLGILGCGLSLLGGEAWAGVTISRVEVDGQPMAIGGGAEGGRRPLRVCSTARSLRLYFHDDRGEARPASRLRYKLEGRDETWRDLPTRMRVVVSFYDHDRRVVGSNEFPLEGVTPGWRGAAERSDFVARREQTVATARSATVQIAFLSHGGPAGLGVVGIDAVRLHIEHAGAERPEVFDLGVTQGTDLSHPLGSPDNWIRTGSRAELAQLRIRPTPAPHPILILDDDAHDFGNWSTHPQSAILVAPGDRVTLDWQTAHSIGAAGPGEANYPHLEPGSYWFRVAAVKADGEPTGQEASLPIVVVPPLYLRPESWLVLAAAAAGGAAWLGRIAVQQRMQRQIRRIEQEHALERERARIARDLHDDIGAGLTEIAMQSDWVRQDLIRGPTAETQRRIERVSRTAVELVRSVDEIVWAVNPANDTLKRFVNYLVQYTDQTLDAAGLRVRFDVPQDLPDLALVGTVRHLVFLAVREALNNAVKHARAELVRLEVRARDATLHLAIEDNGRGFLPDLVEAGDTHEGLGNMRRRMEDVGGQFRLTSRPGAGTRVEFQAPLSNSHA